MTVRHDLQKKLEGLRFISPKRASHGTVNTSLTIKMAVQSACDDQTSVRVAVRAGGRLHLVREMW